VVDQGRVDTGAGGDGADRGAEVLTGLDIGCFARTFEIPRSPLFTGVGAAVGVPTS